MKIEKIKKMAERIKQRRAELHFTQEQFAEIIDITAGSYTKIENAYQRPSLDTLIKISQNLNVSLDYLVFGNTEKQPGDIEKDIILSFLDRYGADMIVQAKDMLENLLNIKNSVKKNTIN